jgi:6-phospho-3-hexuloisomerase
MKSVIEAVSEEISNVLTLINENEAINLSEHLKRSKRIFVYGEGRSGLMGKAFAMRLMHGGFQVYVIGETITPSIQAEDLLIVISGSGSTGAIYHSAIKARDLGAYVFLVTTHKESKLAEISNDLLIIPAATKYRRAHEPKTIQPLGNQFDQSVHLVLDAIIIKTLESDNQSTYETMTERHTNME